MLNLQIKYFGSKISEKQFNNKVNFLKSEIDRLIFYLVIAGTNTSQIKGISAAGIDSKARKITALADAEFFLNGPSKKYRYKLPLLGQGVTPALISYVCSKLIGANPIVVPIGLDKIPYFHHLTVEDPPNGPSNCLSSGQSMSKKRVLNLYNKGFEIGNSVKNPIFISESVPGGTTTAQAVMEAFGLNVGHLIGSSLIDPPRILKKEIIKKGLLNSSFKEKFNSLDVISSVGDPFQAFTLGLVIGARLSNKSVILSGGSQMLAIILLALEFIPFEKKQIFADQIFVATTCWLLRDSSLNSLINLISKKHKVNLTGLASSLNFKLASHPELQDYEKGYVKEGVGAGGMSLLAYLKGNKYEDILSKCEYNLRIMKEFNQIPTKKYF